MIWLCRFFGHRFQWDEPELGVKGEYDRQLLVAGHVHAIHPIVMQRGKCTECGAAATREVRSA
jgi:hypothetical protein